MKKTGRLTSGKLNLKEMIDLLDSDGLLTDLQQVISKIHTKVSPLKGNKKEAFMNLLDLLVTKEWRSTTTASTEADEGVLQTPIFSAKQSPVNSRPVTPSNSGISFLNLKHKRNASISELTETYVNNHKLFEEGQKEELDYLSEFSHANIAVSFPKAKRDLGEIKDVNPGPGSYNPKTILVEETTPSSVIPKGGKRFEFKIPETPGPCYYKPKRYLISK
eukprot:CAMPEP_0202941064 /NCGR_PEP_ID=MMETSP1395-20130829/1162_1 /ASSEMBLY_ACC=CAM_ASM_000871 /TAXON_ID=5961 /ORGANISM="Blepharisma japonicum, Strain Stock R1072" /LENGTH=218 /DNA_ID=CAMNT_0049635931 /DNA_START=1 /DNA_END=657 /DNA_ORIENTATION=-